MKTMLRRLCALLAASNFDKRQVEEIWKELSSSSGREFLLEFEMARRKLSEGRIGSYTTEEPDNAVENRVLELIDESGLTKLEASRLLAKYLGSAFPGRAIAPLNPKSGFLSWIRSLGREFSASEILHVASRLRNERVHGGLSSDDWLRKGETR